MTLDRRCDSDKPAFPAKSSFKDLVRARLRQSVRSRRMEKPSECSVCNQTVQRSKLHGHHSDYGEPLVVSWICIGCHNKLHGIVILNAAKVIEIERLAIEGKSSNRKIAKLFGIAECTVRKIRNHKTWRHIWNEPAKSC